MTELHGMGFAALFLLAFSGALVELYRLSLPDRSAAFSAREQRFMNLYLFTMVALAGPQCCRARTSFIPGIVPILQRVLRISLDIRSAFFWQALRQRAGITWEWSGKSMWPGLHQSQ